MVQFVQVLCVLLSIACFANGQENNEQGYDDLLSQVGGDEFAGDESVKLLQMERRHKSLLQHKDALATKAGAAGSAHCSLMQQAQLAKASTNASLEHTMPMHASSLLGQQNGTADNGDDDQSTSAQCTPDATASEIPIGSSRSTLCSAEREAAVAAKCSSSDSVKVWDDLLTCAFDNLGWMKYRVGGQGGCGGPTTYRFCVDMFKDEVNADELIMCCSSSRCPWSTSLLTGARTAYKLDNNHGVMICCPPCMNWLSPQSSCGQMTVQLNGSRQELLNHVQQAIAAPFLLTSPPFGVSTSELQTAEYGTCDNPMGG